MTLKLAPVGPILTLIAESVSRGTRVRPTNTIGKRDQRAATEQARCRLQNVSKTQVDSKGHTGTAGHSTGGETAFDLIDLARETSDVADL